MNKIRVCFEIKNLATDENGNRCPAGMQLSLGETDKQVDYSELTKNISIPDLLEMIATDGVVKPEDVKIISPEEYDTKYGNDEDENNE